MGEWLNRNHLAHLRVMNWISLPKVTRGRLPSPRSTWEINLEINQVLSPKLRLTSRAGVITWKDTFLTLVQEHPVNFPEHWSNWSNNSDQYIVRSDSQTSWLKPWPPSLTHRCLPSLIWALNAKKYMHRWLISRKGTSINPSTKSWGRRMSTNQACTRSTVLLWAKKINNYKRRQIPMLVWDTSGLTETQ